MLSKKPLLNTLLSTFLTCLMAIMLILPANAQDRPERTAEEIQHAERTAAAAERGQLADLQRAKNPIQIFAAFSESATFTSGDISTDDNLGGDSACFGSLTVTIPAGAIISSVDVAYDMTARNGAWRSEQESFIRAVGGSDTVIQVGDGNFAGVESYNLTGLNIANGIAGGGDIEFEMHAFRDWSSSGNEGCSTHHNKVDNNTWTVTVHYDPPGAVTNPTAFNANAVSDSQIDLSWDLNSEDDDILLAWNTENTFGEPTGSYTPGASITGGGTVLAVGDVTTFEHTGLDDNTTYYYRIWSDREGDYSGGVATSTTTLCSPISSPFAEGFDDASLPACWSTQLISASGPAWNTTTGNFDIGAPHQGARFAHKAHNNSDAILISPAVNLSAFMNDVRINSFMHRHASAHSTDVYRVYVNDSPNLDDAELIYTINSRTSVEPTEPSTGWYNYIISIPEAFQNQSEVYIIFRGTTTQGFSSYALGVDSFQLQEILPVPPNPPSLGFPFADITTNTTTPFTWSAATEGEPATGYKLYLSEVDTFTEGDVVYEGDAISFTASDLDPATTYFWQVVATNANGDSDPSPTRSITTIADGALYQDFSSTTFPPPGWSQENANETNWTRNTATTYLGSGAASRSSFGATAGNPHSLITPLLTVSDGDKLEFMAATSTANLNQRVQVKYSEDGETFTDLGDVIELPQQLWDHYTRDLSGLPDGDYYFAFAVYTTSTSGTVLIDYVRGPEIVPLAPNPVTLTSPANEAVNVNETPTLSWSPAGDGGIPDSYTIYLDQNENPSTEFVSGVETTSYTVTAGQQLDFETTYYWKVVAVNSEGPSDDSAVRSFTTRPDPTIRSPFAQNFATVPPTNWEQRYGVLAEETVFSGGTGATWVTEAFMNNSINGTAARLNLWVSGANPIHRWLITPPIDLDELGSASTLKFDLGIALWASPFNPAQLTPESSFAVVISTDNGATWSSDNVIFSKSGADGDQIKPGGETFYVDLSAYSGTVKLGFYGSRTSGTSPDLRFYLANVGMHDTATETMSMTGWNLMAMPGDNIRIRELATQNHVQGVTGANAFYGVENYDEASPNLYLYNNVDPGEDAVHASWQAPVNFSSRIASGQGFLWYFYNSPGAFVAPMPFTFNSIGLTPDSEVTRTLNTLSDFTLLGNPFNEVISDFGVSGPIQGGVQIWNGDAFIPVFAIEPFQGFFVEKDTDGDVTISNMGSRPDDAPELAEIRFKITGENEAGESVRDHATRFRFNSDATDDWDVYDLTKIQSLNYTSVSLSLIGERDGELVNKVIDSRPIELAGEIQAGMDLNVSNFSGAFELSAEMMNIPEEWSILLIDNISGETTDLRTQSYVFTYESTGTASQVNPLEVPEVKMPAVKNAQGRFTVMVLPSATSTGAGTDLPKEFALNQNYPNPFNPTTQINYDLPEAADVRLDVYNIQGQRVATLVNGSQAAGRHSVNFDASRLSSGVYLYRMQAGSNVFTKKMMLIK